jgi:predicted DNA-binding transcriptional regulator AlpA
LKEPEELEKHLPERQVADLLGVSVLTLRKWRWQRRGPTYVKLEGRTVRYSASAVAAYLAACKSGVTEMGS